MVNEPQPVAKWLFELSFLLLISLVFGCFEPIPAAVAAGKDNATGPREVRIRARPLTQDKTALSKFETAPFPYTGTMPGSDLPFLNIDSDGRLGHSTPYGHVYWAQPTYSDNHVLLHIPKGFDIRKEAVIVVYLHGHGATLERDVWQRQQLPAQISASRANAVLVAPQLAVDAADSSAGGFWQPGAFARFIGEAAQQLGKLHGAKRAGRAFASMPIIVVAYSGGYQSAAYCLDQGGLKKRVRGLVLMDALYGQSQRFSDWVASDRNAFFISTYLQSTESNNADLKAALAARSITVKSELIGDITPGTVVIMPAGEKITHRDLLTKAWADQPVTDLLNRLKRFRNSRKPGG
jgi:hypothetical protein